MTNDDKDGIELYNNKIEELRKQMEGNNNKDTTDVTSKSNATPNVTQNETSQRPISPTKPIESPLQISEKSPSPETSEVSLYQ